ncbi:MAG: reductive dehalogenase domain-containing protein [bacterium]
MQIGNSKHSKPIDRETGFVILDTFKRFNQKDDIFCRFNWDATLRSKDSDDFYKGYDMPFARARRVDGFSQKDYALRNAAWHISNVIRDLKRQSQDRKEGFLDAFTTHVEGWPEPYAFVSKEAATKNIKKAAKFFGADVVGICEYDERWVYTARYSEKTQSEKPIDIPADLPYIILIGVEMDEDLTATAPSALSGSATGFGYTRDTVTLVSLAQYICNLGYRAYATMNDSALAIPLAVQAGLGEVGRHSMLIAPEFGPRLRLGKIFTDIPLAADKPKRFGIQEFCDVCQKCAKACPTKAITFADKSNKVYSRSNIQGVSKWTTHAEKCFNFWVSQNSDCSICIRVWRRLAATPLRRLMLWVNDLLKFGRRKKASWWWEKK